MTTKKKTQTTAPATLEDVTTYRTTGILPKALTLRFLGLLTPGELKRLRKALKTAIDNHELPETGGRARKRRQWAQYDRVESELRQREEARKK